MDADLTAIAGMILSLLVIVMIGAMILLFPLSRRLGALLELRLAEKQAAVPDLQEVAELRRALEGLQAEVARLSEQQEFTERLLQSRSESSRP